MLALSFAGATTFFAVMADTELLLEIARHGHEAWNKWRFDNPKEKVDFSGVDFTTDENRFISFTEFDFGNGADFTGATFGDRTQSEGESRGIADFKDATFGDRTSFWGAKFRIAVFEGATFGKYAWFNYATFVSDSSFKGTTFGGNTEFRGTTFEGDVSFDAIHNQDRSKNDGKNAFLMVSFSGARFLGTASFADRIFLGEANFSNTTFDKPPDFRGTDHRENLDWTGVGFSFGMPVPGWTTDSDTITRLRRLRGIAKEIHAVDAERDLFILERQAERGVHWRDWWRGGWLTMSTGWWRPLTVTILMFFYTYLSGCGRSLLRPIVWLAISNWGFYLLYGLLIDRPHFVQVKKALLDLTLASAIPFGSTARPAFQSAVEVLFEASGRIDIPWQIQAASAAQGITNLVLLFLIGLALRNYFKFR